MPILALGLSGCVYTVEEVFYAQNNATEALMWAMSNPDLTDEQLEKLAKIEEKLIIGLPAGKPSGHHLAGRERSGRGGRHGGQHREKQLRPSDKKGRKAVVGNRPGSGRRLLGMQGMRAEEQDGQRQYEQLKMVPAEGLEPPTP